MGNAHGNKKNNDKALQWRNTLTTVIMHQHQMMFDFALVGLVVFGHPDFIGLHPMLMYYALSGPCVSLHIEANNLKLDSLNKLCCAECRLCLRTGKACNHALPRIKLGSLGNQSLACEKSLNPGGNPLNIQPTNRQ
jgi:hypothetical protein